MKRFGPLTAFWIAWHLAASPALPAEPVALCGPDGTPVPKVHVRVAAIQFCSDFGQVERNRSRLKELIGRAAEAGARIIVLPEACVPGYADLRRERVWSEDAETEQSAHVDKVAELLDGPSVRIFSAFCRERGIYLTLPFIEQDEDRFYNTALLLSPEGKIVLHHRKRHLWDPGDTGWATPGEGDIPVAETPYGRIAVMICMDMHVVPNRLKGQSVDMLLHCGGFYGPNFEGYLISPKYTRKASRLGAALVLANWSTRTKSWWSGYGMSRIHDREGRLLARTPNDLGDAIVLADLPLPAQNGSSSKAPAGVR